MQKTILCKDMDQSCSAIAHPSTKNMHMSALCLNIFIALLFTLFKASDTNKMVNRIGLYLSLIHMHNFIKTNNTISLKL